MDDAQRPHMLMPAISRYMTREPITVSPTVKAAAARDRMTSHRIRHLPIVDGNRLVGLVGASQLETLASVAGINLDTIAVTEVMTAPVTVCGSQTLDEVAELMKQERCDCVVVLSGHGVQGIFTSTDALEALGRILDRALPDPQRVRDRESTAQ